MTVRLALASVMSSPPPDEATPEPARPPVMVTFCRVTFPVPSCSRTPLSVPVAQVWVIVKPWPSSTTTVELLRTETPAPRTPLQPRVMLAARSISVAAGSVQAVRKSVSVLTLG